MADNQSYELVALSEPDPQTKQRFLSSPRSEPYRQLPFVSMDELLGD